MPSKRKPNPEANVLKELHRSVDAKLRRQEYRLDKGLATDGEHKAKPEAAEPPTSTEPAKQLERASNDAA